MPKKTPLTFEQAMRKAESYVGHKEKVLWLLERATSKAEQHYESLLAPWESFQIFLRLIRSSWLAGKYCAPAGPILMAVAAVIYFVDPFDLIPDAIPLLGFVDDASVITFVARTHMRVISSFRKWEVSSR
jgi:uncharacterized membrane protein YkvA (DUF1232 family)